MGFAMNLGRGWDNTRPVKAQAEQRRGAGHVVADVFGEGQKERCRRIVKGLEGLGQALMSLQDATGVPDRRGPMTKRRCDDR